MTGITNRLTVLLADDEENDVFLIRRAFKRLASVAPLMVVPDGEAAIAYLRGDGQYADRTTWPVPRILFLDQWMPRFSGMDVLAWVRTQPGLATLPVVLMSGGVAPAQSELMASLKAAYCMKCIDCKDMAGALEQAIRSALKIAWADPVSNAAWFMPQASTLSLKQRNECSLQSGSPAK